MSSDGACCSAGRASLLRKQQLAGALAQLGERLLCKHQVIGSIPIGSTTALADARHISRDEENEIRSVTSGKRGIGPLFDIVNGF